MKNFLMAATAVASMIATPAMAQRGNGAPSGAHYNLNIIGVSKNKSIDNNASGHVIFVPLYGKANIWLCNSDDPAADCFGDGFKVLDKNGTDQNGAAFALPEPDANDDGVTAYSVFARALGKPGGNAKMTTCATDPTTGEEVCSMEVLELTRAKGRSRFDNVSNELLYIYADLDGDGTIERVPLFGDDLENYFWEYNNSDDPNTPEIEGGLRLAQLRFYPCATDVDLTDGVDSSTC